MTVHPRVVRRMRRVIQYRLKPSFPTAPEVIRLPLLPSGPDGVHEVSPRRTRLSTSNTDSSGHIRTVSTGDFSLAVADCEYRAPLTPHLARPFPSYYPVPNISPFHA